MSVKLRSKKNKNGESFYLDIYHKGNRWYEFIGIQCLKNDNDRKQKKVIAEKYRAKRELEITAESLDLREYISSEVDFIKYFENKVKDSTYRGTLNYLIKFKDFKKIKGVLNFERITEKFVEEFKDFILTKVEASTAWTYLSKLKVVLNIAIKEKIIKNNPAKYVKIKFKEPEKVFLSFDEIKKLNEADCENDDVKKAFLFACFTGLRYSDVKGITWDCIVDDKIHIRQKKTDGFIYIPLTDSAKKILLDMNNNNSCSNGHIFKLGKNERVNDSIRFWARKAGIFKHISFHTSRHTFATMSITYGIDLYSVSKLLGHKSIAMTEIYAKIVNQKLNSEVTKLPVL